MPVNQSVAFFIQWHLTERCNLRCSHCYQEGTMAEELSLDQVKRTIGDVREMLESWSDSYGIEFEPSFNITGGEPFLRQDLFSILEEAGGKGFEVYLLTNGILIDSQIARSLHDTGVKGVQVSLEGPENIHEAIRGRESFGRTLEGVRYLTNEGIPVTLNITLSAMNVDYFTDLINLASGLGVPKLGFSRLVPSGRGLGLLSSMLTRERLKTAYEGIFSASPEGLEIVTGDPVATQMRLPAIPHDAGETPNGGCAAGVSGLTILPDGTITPCRRLNIPIGNVLEDSLREVWATSRVLEQLRTKSSYKGKCGSCRRWSSCRGCRAIAYACSHSSGKGDMLAEDPQCFINDPEG
jgi:AdoMet-dependent heme synthase